MKRLLGQKFNPQESQTHGININTLKVKDNNNNDIKLHCWDFGGQQIMHATHKYINRISCTTKEGISELNNTIQNTLPEIELLNTPFPEKWFKVKTALAEQAKKTNFTSYESYVDICQANGINKESEQNTLINFLHDLGIINHFQDKWLRETNVINPQWITEAVYTIINAPKLAGNGKLHCNDIKTLLNKETYPERKHDFILELMKKFELCYALNDKEYLLPYLFPIQEI